MIQDTAKPLLKDKIQKVESIDSVRSTDNESQTPTTVCDEHTKLYELYDQILQRSFTSEE